MLRYQDLANSTIAPLAILLCLSVFFQILGAPVAFYDLDGTEDPVLSSLFESPSINSDHGFRLTHLNCQTQDFSVGRPHKYLASISIFRPPILPL